MEWHLKWTLCSQIYQLGALAPWNYNFHCRNFRCMPSRGFYLLQDVILYIAICSLVHKLIRIVKPVNNKEIWFILCHCFTIWYYAQLLEYFICTERKMYVLSYCFDYVGLWNSCIDLFHVSWQEILLASCFFQKPFCWCQAGIEVVQNVRDCSNLASVMSIIC